MTNKKTIRKSPVRKKQSLIKKKRINLSAKHYSLLSAFIVTLGFGTWVYFSDIPSHLATRTNQFLNTSAKSYGFKLTDIKIEGNRNTDEDVIYDLIQTVLEESSFHISAHEIKSKVESLPWVRSAKVQKIFPKKLIIHLWEKVPLALYQENKTLTLIDESGAEIPVHDVESFKFLPIVLGKGAREKAPDLFKSLSKQPIIKQNLDSALFISKRRWDLKLESGLKIQLPETDIDRALKELALVDENDDFDLKDIKSIDLRVPKRMYIELTKKAYTAHIANSQKKRI